MDDIYREAVGRIKKMQQREQRRHHEEERFWPQYF